MVIRGTEALEVWSRRVTAGYPGVNIVNMTTSFKDGLAFAAILHRYCPHLIDFQGLKPGDIQANCELVFSTAEAELDIPALLDPQDMAACRSPDRRSILLYLSELYSKLSPLTPVAKPRTIAPECSTTPVQSNSNNTEAKKSRSEYMKARGFTHSRSASIHKINFNSPSLTNLNTSTGSSCSSSNSKPVERKNSVDSGFETNLSCSIDSSSSSQGSPRVSPSFISSTPIPSLQKQETESRLPSLSSSRSTHHLPTTPARSLLNASSLSTSSFSLLSNSDFNVYSTTTTNNNNSSFLGGRRSRGNLDALKKLYRSEDRLHSLRDFALRDVAETTSEEEGGSTSPSVKPAVMPAKKLAKSNLNLRDFDSKTSLITDSSSPKSAFQAALTKFKQSESISSPAQAPPKREEPKTVDKVECFTQTDESHLVRRNQTTCVTPSKQEQPVVAPTPSLGRSVQPVRREPLTAREPLVVLRRSQKPSDRYNSKFRHSSYHFPSDFQANNFYHHGQSTLV